MAAPVVKNREALIRAGRDDLERKARAELLQLVEAAIAAVDPYELVKKAMSLDAGLLSVGGLKLELAKLENIYLAGGGKACFPMARAAVEILGHSVAGGVFSLPEAPGKNLGDRFVFHVAGHPEPDAAGVEGANQLLALARKAGSGDLLIMLLSGGGSAMLPAPAGAITLEELRELTAHLLACGATIDEINAIRKHVSRIKGGRLAQAAFPATVLSLIVSDVVGDPLESIASGPTAPDPSTFADCLGLLQKYGLTDKLPASVRRTLDGGVSGLLEETPKPGDPVFEKTANLIIGSNRLALEASRSAAEKLGYRTVLLTDGMQGEAKQVGACAASVLNSIASSRQPRSTPCLVLLGGETTVTVGGSGKGGRNQELALAASKELAGKGFILSLATDGRDGPTDSAGALVDWRTWQEAVARGLEPEGALADNNSYEILSALGAQLFTGYTGTNVCDLVFLLVPLLRAPS